MGAIFFSLLLRPRLRGAAPMVETKVAEDEGLVVPEHEPPRLWKYARFRVPVFDRRQLREHGPACLPDARVRDRAKRSALDDSRAEGKPEREAARIASRCDMRIVPPAR